MPNTCPTTPYSPDGNKATDKESQTEPKQLPYSDKHATSPKNDPYTSKPIGLSSKPLPYSPRANLSPKTLPYSERGQGTTLIPTPYGDKYFCPLPYLLIDSIHALLIDNSGNKLYINGRL